MWLIVVVQSRSRMKLNYKDLSDKVSYMMKTRQENEITDCTGAVYAENKTKLSSPIRHGAVCDENKIGERCD